MNVIDRAMTHCDMLQILRWNTKMTTQVYIYSPTEATGNGEEGGLKQRKKKWSGMQMLPFIYSDFYMKTSGGMKYSILTQHELWKNKIKHNSSRESGPSCLSVCKSLSLADYKKGKTETGSRT